MTAGHRLLSNHHFFNVGRQRHPYVAVWFRPDHACGAHGAVLTNGPYLRAHSSINHRLPVHHGTAFAHRIGHHNGQVCPLGIHVSTAHIGSTHDGMHFPGSGLFGAYRRPVSPALFFATRPQHGGTNAHTRDGEARGGDGQEAWNGAASRSNAGYVVLGSLGDGRQHGVFQRGGDGGGGWEVSEGVASCLQLGFGADRVGEGVIAGHSASLPFHLRAF